MDQFETKIVLVTGAAGGLGMAIAGAFVDQGATVICADIDATALVRTCEEFGERAIPHTIDLTDEAAIAKLASMVADDFGRLDVLVNNAGLAHGEITTGLFGIGLAKWQRYLAVNSIAPLLLAEALREPLAAAKGIVINQSSMASYVPGTAYGITKVALNAVSFALASQLGPDGVRCVAIAPGMMETERNRATLGDQVVDEMTAMQLAPGRTGSPQDVANLCLFLASKEGSFINNEVIPVDGGHRMRGFRT